MIRLLGKQIALGLLVVLTAITLTFAVVRLSGDPTSLILPQDATTEQRGRALRHSLGLDQPGTGTIPALSLVARRTATSAISTSMAMKASLRVIMRRLPNTVLLAGSALLLAVVFAIPLGVLAAVWQGGVLDRVAQVVSVIGASTPSFWGSWTAAAASLRNVARMAAKTYGVGGFTKPDPAGHHTRALRVSTPCASDALLHA